eukprot:jgi/Chlat1/908/Chrsp108S01420
MRLRRLTSIEAGKVKAELKDLNSKTCRRKKSHVLEVTKSDALKLKWKYSIPKRSKVQNVLVIRDDSELTK